MGNKELKNVEVEGEKPETPLEAIERMVVHVQNTKKWAMAKADTRVNAIEGSGGEIPAAMADALGRLRDECK